MLDLKVKRLGEGGTQTLDIYSLPYFAGECKRRGNYFPDSFVRLHSRAPTGSRTRILALGEPCSIP